MEVSRKLFMYTPLSITHFGTNYSLVKPKKETQLEYGAIGENFTVEGLLATGVFVGDKLRIGELEFVVVKLREPCFKFNAAMGYKGASKAMPQSDYSGWYFVYSKPAWLRQAHKSPSIPAQETPQSPSKINSS